MRAPRWLFATTIIINRFASSFVRSVGLRCCRRGVVVCVRAQCVRCWRWRRVSSDLGLGVDSGGRRARSPRPLLRCASWRRGRPPCPAPLRSRRSRLPPPARPARSARPLPSCPWPVCPAARPPPYCNQSGRRSSKAEDEPVGERRHAVTAPRRRLSSSVRKCAPADNLSRGSADTAGRGTDSDQDTNSGSGSQKCECANWFGRERRQSVAARYRNAESELLPTAVLPLMTRLSELSCPCYDCYG